MAARHTRSADSPVLVAGGGPAGLASALALSKAGIKATVLAAPHRPGGQDRDRRTAALFYGSIEFLRNIGAWPHLQAASAALKAIRIIDDTARLVRAPEVVFSATDVGLDAFGYNVPNAVLVDVLSRMASADPNIAVHETNGVAALDIGASFATALTVEGATYSARIIAAADGRNSLCRTAAGISTSAWQYPQSALVTWFSHSREHHGISTEFHRPAGPFTTVPMPGRASSLVWVETPDEVSRLMVLDEQAFRSAVEQRLQGLLGTLDDIGPRGALPLQGLTPDRFAARRVMLIGEAGHVLPPIGAQGLNLGLRDAATLADVVADALAQDGDPGSTSALNAYHDARRTDVTSRAWGIDILNRSLISELLPVHLLRGAGLVALRALPSLRQMLVREGLQPSSSLPDLMRPNGLNLLKKRAHPAADLLI